MFLREYAEDWNAAEKKWTETEWSEVARRDEKEKKKCHQYHIRIHQTDVSIRDNTHFSVVKQ